MSIGKIEIKKSPMGAALRKYLVTVIGPVRSTPAVTSRTRKDNLAVAGDVRPDVRRRSEHWVMARADEAEFEAYATRDSGRLLGFAMLLAGDRQDAEDLVQLALLRSAGRWSAARQHPEGYTRAVLVNLARDRWRVRRRRYPETLAGNLAQLSPAAGGDAAATVLDRQVLLRACARLPVQQRAVLVLRFWEDRSVQETASVLGCTEGTVKSHTHRALARLRLALQDAPAMVAGPDRKEASC
jgi:RNA polymerase sigma-70 factor (sigma-E family)